jgi:hypothetical protein
MMPHVYALAVRQGFPHPAQEIGTLAQIENGGGQAFLLLTDQLYPPLSGRTLALGDLVYLTIKVQGGLDVYAQGEIGPRHHGATPQSVLNLYGHLQGRWFRQITNIHLHNPPLDATQIGFAGFVNDFLAGQAYMKTF